MGAWGFLSHTSPSSIRPSLNNGYLKYGVGKAAESLLFGSGSLWMGQHLK